MDATVTVTAVESVGPDAVALSFEIPDGFEASPGQFVKLTAAVDGEERSRFYTLSSPNAVERAEVTVAVDPEEGGSFSEYLAARSAGDELDLSGPFGAEFYEGEARAVVLAGGPGVGPAVAIAERALHEGNEAAVVYRTDAPAHGERLDALRDRGTSVTVVGEADGEGFRAAVADALAGAEGERAFVYGFREFVDEAVDALADAGGDPDDAKVESFG